MTWLGDFAEDCAAVPCLFTSHDGNGAPVAPLTAFESADVVIYKNGDAAEKTTTNGLTMTSPFDSKTGLHRLLIDTSNDTGDSGFWTAGAVYTIVLIPDTETVNSQTVTKVIGQFGLALAATALLDLANAIETGVTLRGLARILGAVMGGKLSGAGTATEVFRNTVADSKDRVTATVDASGNRTAITIDQT